MSEVYIISNYEDDRIAICETSKAAYNLAKLVYKKYKNETVVIIIDGFPDFHEVENTNWFEVYGSKKIAGGCRNELVVGVQKRRLYKRAPSSLPKSLGDIP